MTGDKAGFTRTDVMRQFPFPEGEHDFVPEGIVWNAVAQEFRTRYLDEPVLVKDYHADGLTRGGTPVNPRGLAIYQLDLLDKGMKYLRRRPRDLVVTAANYSRFAMAAGDSVVDVLRVHARPLTRLLIIGTLPIGLLLRRFRS